MAIKQDTELSKFTPCNNYRHDWPVLFRGRDKVNTLLKLNEVAVEVFLRQKSENYVPAVCFAFRFYLHCGCVDVSRRADKILRVPVMVRITQLTPMCAIL